MRLNIKVMFSIVTLPFCATLIGCATTIVYPTFESGVVQPATRPAPIVKAPVYKNGDWWKVKFEWKYDSGINRTICYFDYSEYLLEIQEGKPKLYGIDGTNKEEAYCREVEDWILGMHTQKLKFPLSVGDSWNHSVYRLRRRSGQRVFLEHEYKVLGWEKVQTPMGVFEAFKLSSYLSYHFYHPHWHIGTYYYSPKVKAIILYRNEEHHPHTIERDRIGTVVDFNVSN